MLTHSYVNGRVNAAAVSLLLVEIGLGHAMAGDDLEELAGVWSCVSAINDGKSVADETVKKLRLTITKVGGYKTELGDQVLFDSTCKLDSTKTPKRIDMIGTEGENKGKAAQGIYALDRDKLTICYTMPGEQRPNDFESAPGSSTTLVVWKRQRK
jgi:uncharacterized protein (TIGR03067 family)